MFRRWINKDPLLLGIVCFVILAHAAGLYFLASELSASPGKVVKDQKLVVKTVKLHPPPKSMNEEKILAIAPPPSQKVSQPAPPPPPKKKVQKKKPPKPVEKPKPKKKEKVKQPTVDDKRKKLLKQAQETLAKIDQRSDKIEANPTKATKVPKRIDTLSFVGVKSSDTSESSSESAYRSELANHLRAQLQLPEMGNVEVKLIVNQQGIVEKIVIISSENERNADYITKSLPSLKLPPFGKNYSGAKSHTFHITLTNE
jgi:outer membrane biosynthesis protein TonB